MATSFTPSIIHLIPVLSSTASVTFCFAEYWTLIPFLQPSIPPQSLSAFWNNYLYQSIPGWLGLGLTSAVTGYLGWKNTAGITRSMYCWETVFAIGHYTFGPPVAKIIESIVYSSPDAAKDKLLTWLKLHTARMLLVDTQLWFAFWRIHAFESGSVNDGVLRDVVKHEF